MLIILITKQQTETALKIQGRSLYRSPPFVNQNYASGLKTVPPQENSTESLDFFLPGKFLLQKCNHFHMPGLREHVQRLKRYQVVALFGQ